jgi:MraZ protein
MGLFLSTFENRIDKKGRVSVPASYRTLLGEDGFQGTILFPSHKHEAIEGISMRMMETLANRVESHYDFFSDDYDAFAATLFGESVQLAFDGEGRITLPTAMAEHADISDKVAFVGLGKTFQIWSPEKLLAHKKSSKSVIKTQSLTLPQKSET